MSRACCLLRTARRGRRRSRAESLPAEPRRVLDARGAGERVARVVGARMRPSNQPIRGGCKMKMNTLIPASVALFVLGVAPAMSGPCTTEIDALAKTLTAKDAGSGPTPGAAAGAQAPASQSQPQHPPGAVMGREAEGKATSPEDVRRQTGGQPTATQEGTTGAAAGSGPGMEASSALSRAREFDRQGKEAECMAAVREAKQLVAPR